MKHKIKKIIIMMAIAFFSIVSESVYAEVESRPGETHLKDITVNEMFLRSRNLEKEGEALGLTAVMDSYGWEGTPNNIDAHMMKNTEWGAVAYLTQSIYGLGVDSKNMGSDESKTGGGTDYMERINYSTTNTPYGVYDMYVRRSIYRGHYMYVAAHYITSNSDYISTLFSAKRRYKDVYETADASDILGGATHETKGWYNGRTNTISEYNPMLKRTEWFGYWYGSGFGGDYTFRIAVVNGAGL